MRRLAGAVLLAIGAAILVSCSAGPSRPVQQYGIVSGTLQAVGLLPRHPLSGTIFIHGSNGKTTTVATESDGKFSARVAAGTYKVTGRSQQYQRGTRDCQAYGPITVIGGAISQVVLNCEEM